MISSKVEQRMQRPQFMPSSDSWKLFEKKSCSAVNSFCWCCSYIWSWFAPFLSSRISLFIWQLLFAHKTRSYCALFFLLCVWIAYSISAHCHHSQTTEWKEQKFVLFSLLKCHLVDMILLVVVNKIEFMIEFQRWKFSIYNIAFKFH